MEWSIVENVDREWYASGVGLEWGTPDDRLRLSPLMLLTYLLAHPNGSALQLIENSALCRRKQHGAILPCWHLV